MYVVAAIKHDIAISPQLTDFYEIHRIVSLNGLICLISGVDRFSDNIEEMLGKRPCLYFRLCWKYISPTVVTVSKAIGFLPLEFFLDPQYNYTIFKTHLKNLASRLWHRILHQPSPPKL
jgi:hypothetical protein